MTTTMTDLELAASHAAAYLAKELGDGRDYGLMLSDQRCGKRKGWIPFHHDARRRVLYCASDLQEFIASERAVIKGIKSIKRVERIEGAVGSTLPPSRVIAIL